MTSETPRQLRAGDTLEWTVSHPDYPASDGWTLTYKLSGPQQITIAATADGDAFNVSVAAATSATWSAGMYSYAAYVTGSAGERYTIETGSIEVLQNLVTLTGTQEGRSLWQRILEAVEAAMAGRASKQQKSMTVPGVAGGSTIELLSNDELYRAWQRAKAEVEKEKRAERVARGQKRGGRLLFRFGPVS